MTIPLVAYYRVSTQRQGVSGLGLDGQRAAVRDYARRNRAKIVAEYTEIESGRSRRRRQLALAIAHAKADGAMIVVAKLDRLARDTSFLLSIIDGGCAIEFLDFPEVRGVAGRLIVTVMAAVAEFESRRIGERVAAAAKAMRERGGNRWAKRVRSNHKARVHARAARRAEADRWREEVRPTIAAWRAKGRTWHWIAGKLNEQRVATWSGGTWRAANVWRIMSRSVWE